MNSYLLEAHEFFIVLWSIGFK